MWSASGMMVGVQARTIAVTATVVLGVVINLVANLVANHFSWPLIIALVAVAMSLTGAELWLTRPADAGRIGRSARFATVVGSNPAAGHTTRLVTPPPMPQWAQGRRRGVSLMIIGLVVAWVAGISVLLTAARDATPTVTATIWIGGSPDGVAVSPEGRRAYVTNGGSSTVSVIDIG
jgi:DNA-binding beta-propeller fold protein YncE